LPYLMTNKGVVLDLQEAFEDLMGYNVIFFGEEHGSRIDHEAELTVLTELAKRDPKLVLALEMFERDVQDTLDAYLGGTISEDVFLDRSRPWPNYREDYRPLVESAKARGIPVIAANVPRRTAAVVATADEISSKAAGEDKRYLPRILHLDSKEYYQHFAAVMKNMPHGAPMKGMNLKGLYKAQVLKDAVMAAALDSFLNRRILFCCGHFHSDYHLGIPYQFEKNHPDLKVAVIACATYVDNVPMNERSKIADFIWIEK
jgi:uncharacterized iron-regulated protein